jgi:hypothetical protein
MATARAPATADDAEDEIQPVFEQYPAAEWKVGNFRIRFPVCSIQETGGNRIVERERPYRDGAKLDDTGSKAKRWQIDTLFENSINEPDLTSGTSIGPLYPDRLNDLLTTFDIHETGDLTIPTRGKVRARAESYTRNERESDRDDATLQLTFVEDNEDNVGAAQFELPTVEASARRIAEVCNFSAQSEGMWDGSLADLREFGSELEGLATAPGEVVNDIDTQASIVINTSNQVERTFTREDQENRDLLADPELSRTQRSLEESKDMAGRSRAEGRDGRSRLKPYLVPMPSDLFAVAASLGQPVGDLVAINRDVDPLFLPANTIIMVFESLT